MTLKASALASVPTGTGFLTAKLRNAPKTRTGSSVVVVSEACATTMQHANAGKTGVVRYAKCPFALWQRMLRSVRALVEAALVESAIQRHRSASANMVGKAKHVMSRCALQPSQMHMERNFATIKASANAARIAMAEVLAHASAKSHGRGMTVVRKIASSPPGVDGDHLARPAVKAAGSHVHAKF